jgi:hypothetical protein
MSKGHAISESIYAIIEKVYEPKYTRLFPDPLPTATSLLQLSL